MSYWNYRVIKQRNKIHKMGNGASLTIHDTYAIHEVYYNDEGTISASTQNPPAVEGDSMEEVRTILKNMSKALEKPVLIFDRGRSILVEE